jgi:hypothetical protein
MRAALSTLRSPLEPGLRGDKESLVWTPEKQSLLFSSEEACSSLQAAVSDGLPSLSSQRSGWPSHKEASRIFRLYRLATALFAVPRSRHQGGSRRLAMVIGCLACEGLRVACRSCRLGTRRMRVQVVLPASTSQNERKEL